MAFCGKCGASLNQATAFCGSCGTAASASQAQPTGSIAGSVPASFQAIQPASATAPPTAPAWSPVANQQAQGADWTPVQQQASAAPTPSSNWSAVPASAPAGNWAGPVAPPSATAAGPAIASTGTGLSPNLAGALAYSLGIITGILFLVMEPYRRDRFVRFHAMQSILYFVAAVAFSIAWRIVVGILMSISPWIALASVPIRLLISLGMFGLWLFLMYQAYSGREFGIPILGGIARKQADSQS